MKYSFRDFRKQMMGGLFDDNPVLVQMLGMCSTLAVTTSVTNALGMGLAVTAVQGVSNALLVRSLLRLRRKMLSGHAAAPPQGRSLGTFLRQSPRFCLLLAGTALLFFSHNTTSTFLIN